MNGVVVWSEVVDVLWDGIVLQDLNRWNWSILARQ